MQQADVTLRPATLADLSVCLTLMHEMVDELDPHLATSGLKERLVPDFLRALESPDVHVVLALTAAGAIGLARGDCLRHEPTFRLQPHPVCGYVDQMFVQPPFRNAEVGRMLLAALEHWFRGMGLEAALLHAAPRATRFYARLGYLPNRQMYKRL